MKITKEEEEIYISASDQLITISFDCDQCDGIVQLSVEEALEFAHNICEMAIKMQQQRHEPHSIGKALC